MTPKIVVIGSLNMDLVQQVRDFPKPGETTSAMKTRYSPGGKGANQAVAASLSGADVVMLGAVGSDAFGEELVNQLDKYGVHTEYLLHKKGSSGLAVITVNQQGENSIILTAGANGTITRSEVEAFIRGIDANAVLLQNEIAWEAIDAAIRQCKQEGMAVYLNPAPAIELPEEVYGLVDTLILNETETAILSGILVETEDEAEKAADRLLQFGTNEVIITLGSKGCIFKDKRGHLIKQPAFSVKTVDSTAAGDTFIGALAAARTSGQSMKGSLRFASAAAALAVTKAGAQSSIPSRQEVEAFLQESDNNKTKR